MTLLLDVDRDYATWWQLSVDHRGRPAASCFGDATWNPQWYIAAGGDESWWTVEAAIPLAELAPHGPRSATSGPLRSSASFPGTACSHSVSPPR